MNTNTEQLLPKAFSLHQAGNIVEAESLYRTILKEDSNNPLVLSMLGMLCMQRGDWQEGMQLLNASLAIEPDQPDTLSNLGYALQNLQRYDEALTYYDKAIELFPDHVSAYYNRGNALQHLGRYEDAAASFQKALTLRPNHVNTCVNLGNALAKLGRHDEALSNYIKALNLKPGDAGIANNLGLALQALGRNREALNYFSKAIAAQPDYADAHFNLALTLQRMGSDEEALGSYDKVIALQSEHAEAHCQRGQILQRMGRHEEALTSYQSALAINPEHVGALTHLGVLHMEQGRSAEAVASFMRALEIDPECAVACHNLSMLGHYAKDQQACEQMQSLYDRRDDLVQDDRVYLDFAMGKAMEDAGRYDEAFAAYEEGNRLYYQEHSVDEEAAEKFLEDSMSFFSAELIEQCRNISDRLDMAGDARTPVFIVGMPRSGTTLIEQILSTHPQVFGAGELKVFDEVTEGLQLPTHDAPEWDAAVAHLGKLGQVYRDRVWQRAPEAGYITDKLPGNFMHLGLIHLMLPKAKIIHAMRDPMDSCFSCYTHRFQDKHNYAYDLGSLGRYYQRYVKLMQHWHDILPQDSILDVGYENMVADPEREVRRLLDYLGLPWDEACLRFYENKRTVRTASLNQVRKPIYSSSVARWKHFEKHLQPLIEIIRTAP